jgi:hypothetical protein
LKPASAPLRSYVNGDAAAALPHAVAPVGAPSVYHYSEGPNPSPSTPLPTTLSHTTIQLFAFERAVLRNICSLQLRNICSLQSGALFLLQLTLRRFTVSLVMSDTPKAPLSHAPTPTILPDKLVASSRPSRYAPRAEHARKQCRLSCQGRIGNPSMYPPVKIPAKHQFLVSLSNRGARSSHYMGLN